MRHPKIIHRVWLGPNEPDPFYASLGARWAELHPGWSVVEWDDERVELELEPLALAPEYADAPTYVHRADMILVEAVARFGGMAVGWDMEPLRNLEELIGESEGWNTPDADGFPGGGLFGARAGHPGVLAVLVAIRRRVLAGWDKPNLITGPYAWDEALGPNGMLPGGLESLGSSETAYPIHWQDRALLADRDGARARALELGAYALHYFAGTWLEGSGVDVNVRRAS